VKALSPDVGVLSLLVKGAKSKKSPFRACIDSLAHSEIEIRYNSYKGNSSLIIPKELCLQNYFSKMRSNLQNLAAAQLMAEILLKLGNGQFNAAAEFNWLLNNLKCLELNAMNENSLSLWLHDLCKILGYAPRLSKCSSCGQELLQGPADLWPAYGGAVCKNCLGTRKPHYDSIFLQELGNFATGKSNSAQNEWRKIENFFLGHLKIHTGALDNLKSHEWLIETRRLSG
jgi:DNA repair protein RecO (recombination protein O)